MAPASMPENILQVGSARLASWGPADTLQVVVQGYRATCIDSFFGKLFGQSSYAAGLNFLTQCGPVDNQNLGGALLEIAPGSRPRAVYTVDAVDNLGTSNFSVELSIDSVS